MFSTRKIISTNFKTSQNFKYQIVLDTASIRKAIKITHGSAIHGSFSSFNSFFAILHDSVS
jgi:hypothetical protein